MSVNNPETLSKSYNRLWSAQFNYPDGHIAHFYRVREHFNAGDKNPTNMLYLLARCVKGAVRYGKDGCFNQSPDKRRHGKNPKRITESIHAISHLLKGRTQFLTKDYREIFEISAVGDILYMDPPYQGVTNVRDNRYFSGVDYNDFSESLEILNRKGIDFIISYDGECGGKVYGNELPNTVGCTKLLLNAGLSSQATLLGKRSVTYEALYMSRGLAKLVEHIQKYSISKQITLVEYVYGRSLP
jgi:DNA adenine methylase